MISQEKLVTAKGRTEPLCKEIRNVVLYQRMQGDVADRACPYPACVPCAIDRLSPQGDGCRCETFCQLDFRGRNPVAFPGKRIGWQTDPTRQGRSRRDYALRRSEGCKTPPYIIQELPINVHPSHPYLRYLCEILLLAPDM